MAADLPKLVIDSATKARVAFGMRLLLLLSLLVFSSPSLANESAVFCVQNQLQAAGQPVGTPDGVIGPRTRDAWRRFAQTHDLNTAMALDDLTAPNHCHRIGMADPSLQAHWPATEAPFDFVFAPEIPREAQLRIQDAAHRMTGRVAALLGVQVAARSHAIVGTQAASLGRLINQTVSYRIRGLEQGLQRDCGTAGSIGAAASRGMMRFCIPDLVDGAQKLPLRDLDFVMSHEITHVIEMQIEGDTLRQPPGRSARPGHPPLWMIEGLADLVGAHLTTGRSPRSLRIQVVHSLNGQAVPPLGELDGRAALDQHRDMVYRVGLVAVAELVDQHGFASFGRLFEDIGNGQAFEPAFEAQFGQTLAVFEERIDRIFVPSRQFASGGASSFPEPTAEQAEAIRCVQTQLARLGFNPGGADGMIGPQTQNAFDAYLRANPRRGAALTPLSAQRWCDRLGG